MPGKVTLKVVEGPLKGRSFLFEEHDNFIAGRSRSCHLHLPKDPYMSRHHFLLEINPPMACLRDLGSMNGTYVNGVRCGGRKQFESPENGKLYTFPQVNLRDADRIQIGETVIAVIIEQPELLPEPIRCGACDRITSELEYDAEGGGYICKWCWEKVIRDPIALLGAGAPIVLHSGENREATSLRDYQVLQPLREGSKGAVNLAVHTPSGREVALKVMVSKSVVEDDARESFLRAIGRLSEVNHPNIVAYRGAGSRGGVFFVILDYCNQGSVLDLMSKHGNKLSVEAATPLMLDAACGLAVLHSHGVVHRDIKPQNILLHEEAGTLAAKLADFALSHHFDQGGFGGLSTTSTKGDTFLPYMPPEQLTEYAKVQPVSDVWSLAATFYTMLTGEYPRVLPENRDPLAAILEGKIVPLKKRCRAIPEALEIVISRGLALSPSERYADGAEFLSALEKSLY